VYHELEGGLPFFEMVGGVLKLHFLGNRNVITIPVHVGEVTRGRSSRIAAPEVTPDVAQMARLEQG